MKGLVSVSVISSKEMKDVQSEMNMVKAPTKSTKKVTTTTTTKKKRTYTKKTETAAKADK
jgi:hypothetical protein